MSVSWLQISADVYLSFLSMVMHVLVEWTHTKLFNFSLIYKRINFISLDIKWWRRLNLEFSKYLDNVSTCLRYNSIILLQHGGRLVEDPTLLEMSSSPYPNVAIWFGEHLAKISKRFWVFELSRNDEFWQRKIIFRDNWWVWSQKSPCKRNGKS